MAKKSLEELYQLWEQLGDIPTFPESTEKYEVDSIEMPFLHFGIGTHREEIWHWFEEQNPLFLVGEVQSGVRYIPPTGFALVYEGLRQDGDLRWSNFDQRWTAVFSDSMSERVEKLGFPCARKISEATGYSVA